MTGLKLISTRLTFPTAIGFSPNITLILNIKMNALPTSGSEVIWTGPIDNNASDQVFMTQILPDGKIRWLTGAGRSLISSASLAVGIAAEVKVVMTGLVSGQWNQGLAEFFIDGVSQGTLIGNAHPFSTPQIVSFGNKNNEYASGAEGDLNMTLYEASAVSDDYSYTWSADGSDTSATGVQPILVDTTSGNNATGESFPTDGSAWEVAATPAVTTTDTLSPGTEFTLTATNYASAPVSPATLTDSVGSTITVPVTISGSGPYTAVGTMPTLAEAVTAGTSLLFGDVTIELTT